ncbi:MAG: hypothetical protein LBU28_00115 [Spirochaetaceae bacterium]|jgi:23S rRNA (cytidine2498-2'-O)-methyltransferase|nr:hypothetical protein [Spirochaetaceae bacterium]
MRLTPLEGRIYLAIPGLEDHLRAELPPPEGVSVRAAAGLLPSDSAQPPALSAGDLVNQRFVVSSNPPAEVFWCQDAWLEPFRLEFGSINEAARALRDIQRNWAPVLFTQFRRGALIQEKLPPLQSKPRPFPWLLPDSPLGAWTLLDAHTLVGSARCESPFPGGVIRFEEDRRGPPSRAYLKLQEALVRCRKWPAPGDRCLDAGASPGGWTWVLARLGAQVTAVDRAPPDRRILALEAVRYLRHDAFTLPCEDLGPQDWVFSDVVCYPPRLLEWIEKWLASGLCENFVCTVKFQGCADDAVIRRFAALPAGRLVHLYHNKHELTWIRAGG